MNPKDKKPTFIDMFCGCGGFSAGFQDAGFDLLFGIDSDKASLETYNRNFGLEKGINIDLFSKTYLKQIQETINLKKQTIDVIVAGPPCQGFSLTGPRNFDDQETNFTFQLLKW